MPHRIVAHYTKTAKGSKAKNSLFRTPFTTLCHTTDYAKNFSLLDTILHYLMQKIEPIRK